MPRAPVPAEVDRFLTQPNPAVMATLTPGGHPHTAATWYDWEGGRLLLNFAGSRRRLGYLRADPRAAVTAMADGDWYRQVTLMGDVVAIERDPDLRDIDRLAVRYTGKPFARRTQERWSAWMRVDRWFGWEGGAPWPRADA
jgi:PPOX class probable F420-dependent enzyme